jgi:uncharacterized protein
LVRIDWDPYKAEANLRAHGVRFSEAATVLADDHALTREDPDAIGEQRANQPQRKQYEEARR